MGTQLEISGGSKVGSASGSEGGGAASTEASGWQGTNLFEVKAKASVVTKVQAKDFFALYLIDGSSKRVFYDYLHTCLAAEVFFPLFCLFSRRLYFGKSM